jgi:ABC-type glycerol-3-phosphate transport system substrate-binding protein
MSDDHENKLSRKRFLKLSAGGLAAAGLAPVLAACGGDEEAAAPPPAEPAEPAPAEPAPPPAETAPPAEPAPPALSGSLDMWWWGEQEAVGIQGWVDETNALFQDQTGVSVTTNLLDTGLVIPDFQTAAAAGQPPDVQFFWNGIYHMESVWLGYVEPLNGLIPDDVLAKSGATSLSVFGGEQFRVGWYALGLGWAYNKELFDKAGLDADAPPTTWDAFLDALDKLKSSGVIPIGGGVKDGYWGEWYLDQSLTQQLDTPGDALSLFIGALDWRDPRYHEHWVKLEELYKGGYINEDINSLDLYPGIQLLDAGKAAISQNVSPGLVGSQEALGEKLGFMMLPTFGTGAMAGIPILDTQGFGIAAKSDNKEAAAALLALMHTPERVNAIYTATGQIPANQDFDSSLIDNPLTKHIYDNWVAVPNNVYIPDLMPTLFWTDAMFVASQKILGGEMTGEEAGELATEITEKWKQQNPDLVEKYSQWSEELAA